MKTLLLGSIFLLLQFIASGQIFVDGISYGGTPNDSRDDDTKAFQAALNAANGRMILFKKGVYHLNGEIRTSNVYISGDSTLCRPKDINKPVFLIVSNGVSFSKNISFSRLFIDGDLKNPRVSDGIMVKDTMNGLGCDFLSFNKVEITNCRYGMNVATRSIWNKLYDCQMRNNKGGLLVRTGYTCNLWDVTACVFNWNDSFGVYIQNLNTNETRFLNFRFQSCNFESNGTRAGYSGVTYGGYFEGVEMLGLDNLYCEGNGNKTDGEAYGIKITGVVGRLFTISNSLITDTKYPLYIDGFGKSGTVSSCFIQRSLRFKTGFDIYLKSSWGNDEPKIDVQNCYGSISNELDVTGNMSLSGIDWDAKGNSTQSFRNRNWLKINASSKDVILNSITGVVPGQEFGIINYSGTGKKVIIDNSLTVDKKDIVINPNQARRFIVDTYPDAGKIRVLE